MRSRASLRAAFCAALLAALLPPPLALAQKPCAELRVEVEREPAFRAVNTLANASCLGGVRDDHEAAKRVQALFATASKVEGHERAKIRDVDLSAEERRALSVAVLRVASEYLETVNAPEADALRRAVQKAMRDRNARVASREAQMSYWTWDGQQQLPLGATGIDVRSMLSRPGTRAAAESLVRASALAERAFTPDQAQAIQEAQQRAEARDERWRSYFSDTRSQYPWELLFNSMIYESTVRSEQGISGPPRWQLIALHPDIGMQYVRSADAGDRFKPALLLEIVGFNRWSWGVDNTPQNAWGASVVRTYADTASIAPGAWGVAVHYNSKYTATLTRSDGKTGLVLSVDLAGAVTKAGEEWRDRFRVGR
jgi:hypothetical protein